jgi:hypothetical protein
MRSRTVAVLLCVLGLVGCGSKPSAPSRPRVVPKSAVWAGGIDGGSWIDCHPSSTPGGSFPCEIYSDQLGEREASGAFVFDRIDVHPRSIEELTSEYSSWDGDRIHLRNGNALVPDGWLILGPGKDFVESVLFERGKEVRRLPKGKLPPKPSAETPPN